MVPRSMLLAVVMVSAPGLGTAQRTWLVDQAGGPGVQFTDIPPAIAAASPGDRIEVRGTATYSLFSLTRGLDIEATQGATVPEIWIENVPAAEAASVAGFRVGAPVLIYDLGSVQVSDCAGTVELASLRVTTGVFTSRQRLAAAGIEVRNARAALVTDCSVLPGRIIAPQGIGLAADNSRVLAQRCTLEGSRGDDHRGIYFGYAGVPGISLRGSSLTAAVCRVTGGRGGDGITFSWAGGDAVLGDGGLFLASCTLVRGVGGSPFPIDGNAIQGRSRVTTDCLVTGGIAGGGGFVPPLPWLASPGQLTQGVPATLTCNGVPGALFVLLLDTSFDITPIAGLDCAFGLTAGFFVGDIVAIGASGSTSHAFTLPRDPTWQNRFLFFQAIALQPAGPSLALTNLGDFRMR